MSRPRIVLVEDDAVIAELLEFNVREAGYEAIGFRDGKSLLDFLGQNPEPPDLFILDLMLPGMDGYEICAWLRGKPEYDLSPILMLTARSSESDKVRGLEKGADDYLTKPFGMRELLARIQALLRRSSVTRGGRAGRTAEADDAARAGTDFPAGRQGRIAFGDLLLDDLRHRVFKKGQEIEMTNREYELLKFLMLHRGVAYSRDDLLDHVWGYEYSGETRTVDVHIRQLRRKLEDNDADPVLIETVRGRGYRFADKTDSSAAKSAQNDA